MNKVMIRMNLYLSRLVSISAALIVSAGPNAIGQESPSGVPARSYPPVLLERRPSSAVPPVLRERRPFLALTADRAIDAESTTSPTSNLPEALERLGIANQQLKHSLQQLQLERFAALKSGMPDGAQVLRDAIWQTNEIHVSWENPSPQTEQERRWVKEAVEETWQKECGIRFVGWDAAGSDTTGIRIRVSDEQPHCERLGKYLDGLKNGMVLNFNYANWCQECGVDRKKSIKIIAAHEFGHALGFAHEHNRDDRPMSCQKEKQGSDGDFYITLYDPSSIMNYCNETWNNNGRLSADDIYAARVLYGNPGTPLAATPPAVETLAPPVASVTNALPMDLGGWLQAERTIARDKILANILSNGAVIASPSRSNPNYYYHWVRDAALTMDVVVSLYADASDASTRRHYLELLTRYVNLSLGLQVTNNLSTALSRGVGEPKFHTDGSAYNDNWGRPQDDGPALRAASLCRLAHMLLDRGDDDLTNFVKTKLYDGRLPSNSVIKRDLEYVSHNWQRPSVDLWEEVYGHHFYTRIAQRRGLREGAKLASRLGDQAAAEWYSAKAAELERALQDHWQSDRGYLIATFDQQGKDYKTSNLDVSIVLGVLHTRSPNDGFLSPTNDHVLSTARKLADEFDSMYRINRTTTDSSGGRLGVAIGRYPEDRYSGSGPDQVGGGNPWYLCTAALGELYYSVANEWESNGSLAITGENSAFLAALRPTPVTVLRSGETLARSDARFGVVLRALREAGDAQLRRVKFHAGGDGSLAEQVYREDGFARSARDLTWSYASILTAAAVRSGQASAAQPLTSPPSFAPSPFEAIGPVPEGIPDFARPLNRGGVPATRLDASLERPNARSASERPAEDTDLRKRISDIENALREFKDAYKAKKPKKKLKSTPE
ncbi:Astacin (Peptidase family M12A) [Singulisphaera sp. GP187]|uniref:glycoside hydrolase family 15 protein n=1 Tax=Singulisphaera sp. GP187 TaxID=1882752 RepID=UPI00092ACEBB|nr:glycoside hydrolase family 15 protein [Singulisphaera sp. GP187]SIO26811.1 Astacin (Peptidase family M12A) [Singulisphaera sp. GP187]